MMEFGERNEKAQERFLRHLRDEAKQLSPSRSGAGPMRLILHGVLADGEQEVGMRVIVRQEDGSYVPMTLAEFLDRLLVEATARVEGGSDLADLQVEEALSVAAKVDELVAKMVELEGRIARLELEAER